MYHNFCLLHKEYLPVLVNIIMINNRNTKKGEGVKEYQPRNKIKANKAAWISKTNNFLKNVHIIL